MFEGHVINLIICSINGKSNRFLGYKLGIIGLYYNLITPMASGSQPMQIYELSKSKVCTSKDLNLNGTSFVCALSLQVFLYMAVSSMPTPGNVGANEVAFFTIFAGVIPKGLLGYSVFLYGIFVYYFLLIVCGLFTIFNQAKIKNKLKFSSQSQGATFLMERKI